MADDATRLAALEQRITVLETTVEANKRTNVGAIFAFDMLVDWALAREAKRDANPAARLRAIIGELRQMFAAERANSFAEEAWLFEQADTSLIGWESVGLRLLGALPSGG